MGKKNKVNTNALGQNNLAAQNSMLDITASQSWTLPWTLSSKWTHTKTVQLHKRLLPSCNATNTVAIPVCMHRGECGVAYCFTGILFLLYSAWPCAKLLIHHCHLSCATDVQQCNTNCDTSQENFLQALHLRLEPIQLASSENARSAVLDATWASS